MDNFTLEVLELFLSGNRKILEKAARPPEISTPAENIATLNEITMIVTNQIREINAKFLIAVEEMKNEIGKKLIQIEGSEQ